MWDNTKVDLKEIGNSECGLEELCSMELVKGC
jgi:hypothetical protein